MKKDLEIRDLSSEEQKSPHTFLVKVRRFGEPGEVLSIKDRYQYITFFGKISDSLRVLSRYIYCVELNRFVKFNDLPSRAKPILEMLKMNCVHVTSSWLEDQREYGYRDYHFTLVTDPNANPCGEVKIGKDLKEATRLSGVDPEDDLVQSGIGIGSSLRELSNENEPQEGIGISSSLRSPNGY